MKKIICIVLASVMLFVITSVVSDAAITHTVERGDSLWKLAVKYQVGLSEIKAANPTIKNYDLIYPGQQINIPTISSLTTAFEAEVVHLVNQRRAEHGLKPLI